MAFSGEKRNTHDMRDKYTHISCQSEASHETLVHNKRKLGKLAFPKTKVILFYILNFPSKSPLTNCQLSPFPQSSQSAHLLFPIWPPSHFSCAFSNCLSALHLIHSHLICNCKIVNLYFCPHLLYSHLLCRTL